MTTQTQQDQRPAVRAQQAWQDGFTTLLAGYARQSAQLANFWGLNLDPDQVSEAARQLGDGLRDVTIAQVAVAQEWLQAPYWSLGLASPQGLQQRYTELIDAYSRLFSAYTAATRPLQRAALQTSARASETARAVIDTQARTVGTVTRDLSEAQAAATEAAVETSRRVTRQTTGAVEQAAVVAEETTERVAAEARRTAEREERERSAQHAEWEQEHDRDTRREDREQQHAEREHHGRHHGRNDQQGRVIKGHVSANGEKIYHLPGQSSYERTQADATFHSEEEARAAGFRRAETPGGGHIKGHISRDGEKLYHLPEQANYERLSADFLFETEEQAQAEGFRPAQR